MNLLSCRKIQYKKRKKCYLLFNFFIKFLIISVVFLVTLMAFAILCGGIPIMPLTDEVRKILFMGMGGALGAIASYLYSRYMLDERKIENTLQKCSFIKGILSRSAVGFFFPMAVFGAITAMSFFSIDIKQNKDKSESSISQSSYADLSPDKIFIISIFLGFIARRSLRWGERFMEQKENEAFKKEIEDSKKEIANSKKEIEDSKQEIVTFKKMVEREKKATEDFIKKTNKKNEEWKQEIVKQQKEYLMTVDIKLQGLKEASNTLAMEEALKQLINMKNTISGENIQLYTFILARYNAATKNYYKAIEHIDILILDYSGQMTKAQRENIL